MISGDYGETINGYLIGGNGSMTEGAWSLAVFGNRGDVMSSGFTIIDQQEVDFRCSVFDSVYDGYNTNIP